MMHGKLDRVQTASVRPESIFQNSTYPSSRHETPISPI